jgi:HAD superfamily hydrolase (TIGR01549 family)
VEYEAVLFDWMLTLADYPDQREHIRRANRLIGRLTEDADIDAMVGRLLDAANDDDVVAAARREDCSPELHRAATMLLFNRAAIDDELAEAMYALLGDPVFHPIYPETAELLKRLAQRGVRVAVISDIHVDLRVHAKLHGIGNLVDEWVLSYEHGVQKPDLAIFQLALDALHVDASAALMVGDRASHDGAAAELGIDTLILPAPVASSTARRDRLRRVLRLVGA